jgi:hypothetical protein
MRRLFRAILIATPFLLFGLAVFAQWNWRGASCELTVNLTTGEVTGDYCTNYYHLSQFALISNDAFSGAVYVFCLLWFGFIAGAWWFTRKPKKPVQHFCANCGQNLDGQVP